MDGGKKHKGLDGIPITPAIGDMTSDHEFNEFMSVMKDENMSVMKDENTTTSGGLTTKTKKNLLAAAFSPAGEISRARKCMDFVSILLFTIGSIFYMHLSCIDFKYGVIELRSLPVSVYTAEDKSVLYTYVEEHDDHNYADDYIPNLQLNGYGVTYYQISYICAGLCFVIAGKEMCCAVYPTDSGKWVKKYLLFGDITYFAGSAIDVPLAYLWVFDRTSFWNNSIWTWALIGGVLWLVCSFVYMVAFFRGDLYPNAGNGPQPKRLSKVVIHAVRRMSSQGEETNATADDSCIHH